MRHLTVVAAALFIVGSAQAFPGCGCGSSSSGDDENESTEDAGSDTGDDVQTIGDVSGGNSVDHRCGDALEQDWPFNDAVSEGEVSTSTEGGVTTAEIDASAGGSDAS